MLSRRKSNLVLLDEGSHVLVANNGAFPFLYAEYIIGNDDLGILLDLRLASQTIVLLNLLTGEETYFSGEDVAGSGFDDTLALAALATATTSRRQEERA